MVNFNENVSLGLPANGRLSNQPDELAKAIADTPATGQTALYDALYLAYRGLEAGTREKKALVVISDGGDNASSHTLAGILKLAGQSSAVIYTIGIFADEDPDREPGCPAHAGAGDRWRSFLSASHGRDCHRLRTHRARSSRTNTLLAYNSSNADAPGCSSGASA